MKYLITGCAGFIGSHISEFLLKRGDEVIGLDILNNNYNRQIKKSNLKILKIYKTFCFLKEDFCKTNAIAEHKPDYVIHFGAFSDSYDSIVNPTLVIKHNIEGSVHLLKESIKHKIKYFFYASCSSVYGNKTPAKENDILLPNNSYSCSKLCMEEYMKLYSRMYDIKTIGFRFFNVYGPRGRVDMSPFKFLYNIAKKIPIEQYGDGTSTRDYIFIDDVIYALIHAIDNRRELTSNIYNIGSGKQTTLTEFIEICEDIVDRNAEIEQKEIPHSHILHSCADITLSKKI